MIHLYTRYNCKTKRNRTRWLTSNWTVIGKLSRNRSTQCYYWLKLKHYDWLTILTWTHFQPVPANELAPPQHPADLGTVAALPLVHRIELQLLRQDLCSERLSRVLELLVDGFLMGSGCLPGILLVGRRPVEINVYLQYLFRLCRVLHERRIILNWYIFLQCIHQNKQLSFNLIRGFLC